MLPSTLYECELLDVFEGRFCVTLIVCSHVHAQLMCALLSQQNECIEDIPCSCLSIHPSIRPSVCLSVRPSICPPAHLPACLPATKCRNNTEKSKPWITYERVDIHPCVVPGVLTSKAIVFNSYNNNLYSFNSPSEQRPPMTSGRFRLHPGCPLLIDFTVSWKLMK